MEIRTVDIGLLRPADYNPRKDLTPKDPEYQKIKKSIEQFGYLDPIIWNERSGRVVGGHQRLKVLNELGHKKIEVVVADLADDDEKAFNIALNKIAGDWDLVKLDELLRSLEDGGLNIEFTGFTDEEISKLFNFEKQGLTDDDAIPEVPDKPKTKPGDFYLLDRHWLLCGDATKRAEVEHLMGHYKADMVFIDPPYNVDYTGRTKNKLKIKNDNMRSEDFIEFLYKTYLNMEFALKPGGCFYIAHSEGGGGHDWDFRSALRKIKNLNSKQFLVWIKNSAVLGRQDYNWQHEPILYGWKSGAAHYFCCDYTQTTVIDDEIDMKKIKKKELIQYCENLVCQIKTTIIRVDRPTVSSLHPNMKPVSLIKKLIKNSSIRKQIILDLFGGSGSTLIACEKTERKCYMMEDDPHYCDVIIKRWEDYTGKKSELIGGVL